MDEEIDKTEGAEKIERQEIFSKAVRAGKRTYFFDVKSTRRNDNYLTITESKKRYHKDGRFYFEKHKIFLYKEDFDKFIDGLTESVDFIKSIKTELLPEETLENSDGESNTDSYTNVEFEDLESVEVTEDQPSDKE